MAITAINLGKQRRQAGRGRLNIAASALVEKLVLALMVDPITLARRG